jgi:uncharacterized ion transporter superfamily protein YfcC
LQEAWKALQISFSSSLSSAGVFGILQRTGALTSGIHWLVQRFSNSGPLLTIILMTVIAIGGSTLGMGEEFIPLVPIFLFVSKEMGYDRIFGLALVMVAGRCRLCFGDD